MTLIPLTDESRRPTRFPAMTTAIIAMNVFVFALEILGGDAFVQQWSVIPADIVAGRSWLTIITAMFMHGGWM
ncbi:MAG TPA: rhomboid family intramembrane serine protease, partial [Terriglobia bacterium]|nr:rhomboid family intramembrane serine protease [Terriglobia bacterium]